MLGGRTTGARKLAKLVVLFLTAFVGVGAFARLVAPPNPDFAWHPTLNVKLDHLDATEEHYEVVFVGDSRVFRAINPAIVEDELDALGCPASVFNFGAVAMTKFEFDAMMEHLATTPGGAPDIVVSVDALTLQVGLVKDFSIRHRGYMSIDTAEEYLEYRANLPADDFDGDTVEIADMAAGYLVNQIPVGAFYEQLFEQPALDDEEQLIENGGFQPWDEFYEEAGAEGMANLYATLAPEFENGGWDERWRREADIDPRRIDDWVATIDAHVDKVPESSQAVHMFLPSFYDEGTIDAVIDRWEDSGRQAPMFSVVDEDLVGDYTDPQFFMDFWHLDKPGSDAVSRAAGRQLCPIVEQTLGR